MPVDPNPMRAALSMTKPCIVTPRAAEGLTPACLTLNLTSEASRDTERSERDGGGTGEGRESRLELQLSHNRCAVLCNGRDERAELDATY